MKHNWLISGVSAAAIIMGTAWTQSGVAYAVSFTPPSDNVAPRGTTGGASRGSFFTPPSDNVAPRGTTGGASRGGFFTPPSDAASPRGTTGGASRGSFFMPPSDSAAPRGTTGGASRDNFFTPPSDAASPRGTTGGASRGLFNSSGEAVESNSGAARSNIYGETVALPISSETSMLAVMPDSFFGKTVEARPTVLVYVPASDASEAMFSIKDEVKDSVYEMTVAVPSTGGVIAVELPESAPELAVGQNYQWYLALKMDGELKPSSPFVDGWVKRVSPDGEIARAGDSISEIESLGANGIWYDTASKLAALQVEQNDEAISNHWYELLESVGLADIATVPIIMGDR